MPNVVWCDSARLKEGRHLNEVLNHPVFQKDPLSSIHQHLQNTQPSLDEEPKKKPNKNGGKKKKSKKSKALSGQQSMEIWIKSWMMPTDFDLLELMLIEFLCSDDQMRTCHMVIFSFDIVADGIYIDQIWERNHAAAFLACLLCGLQ